MLAGSGSETLALIRSPGMAVAALVFRAGGGWYRWAGLGRQLRHMGISLRDLKREDHWFHVNFWNWRPLVELIRQLDVIAPDRVTGLHEPFCNNGLTEAEAKLVADALEARVLPTLGDDERVLLDGARTMEPDDFVFHRTDQFKNYSTSRAVLGQFIAYCRASSGFEVL